MYDDKRGGKEEGRGEKEKKKQSIHIKGNAVTTIARLVMPVFFGLSSSFSIAIFACTHTYI